MISDLAGFPHLTLLEQGRAQPWLLRTPLHALTHWQPDDRRRFSTMSAVYAATLGGIAQLPHWLVSEDLRTGHQVELLPGSRSPGLSVYVVWLKTPAMPRRLRCAIDALLAAFPR